MAFVQTAQSARIDLFATLRASIEDFKAARALRQKYNTTVRELARMSDRELNDIGVDRYDIHSIATQHTYG
ncbi:DUF1127 domain-containing protein [uncultured Shimia sp.]|uniref:DUF1127 domain-containing protein n=1 Tax=uncultured Shimia sp. TaxID=573152 RepID=UPI0025EB3190|nr:DUF1127 domain-containing protein [uncultured Shimia sp.]